MSIRLIADILDYPEEWPASKPDTLVLIALADRCNERDECFPSVEDISLRARLGERATQYALRRLERLGCVVITKRPGTSSLYRLQRARGATDCTPQRTAPLGVQQTAPTGVQPSAPESSRESSDEPNGMPDREKRKSAKQQRDREVTPLTKADSLVGASPQVARRSLRGQKSRPQSSGGGTVIPSKPKRETGAEIAQRLIREGQV